MSKNLRGIALPGGVAHSCLIGMNKMTNVESVKKAFHKARIEGEQLLSQRKITWDEYAFIMLGFEAKLRSMGVNLWPIPFVTCAAIAKTVEIGRPAISIMLKRASSYWKQDLKRTGKSGNMQKGRRNNALFRSHKRSNGNIA
jgi:hypothetical protein